MPPLFMVLISVFSKDYFEMDSNIRHAISADQIEERNTHGLFGPERVLSYIFNFAAVYRAFYQRVLQIREQG